MSFDKKDKAIVECSALIGYCKSAPVDFQVLSEQDKSAYGRWVTGLLRTADRASDAVDAVFNESNIQETNDGQ